MKRKYVFCIFKTIFIIQSFLPLTLLLLIKYCPAFNIDCQFSVRAVLNCYFSVLYSFSPLSILHWMCLIILAISILSIFLFKSYTRSGYHEETNNIIRFEDISNDNLVFFMSIFFPLLMNGLDEWRGFLVFLALICILVVLMYKTCLFYNNPILTLLGYKVYSIETRTSTGANKHIIGISSCEFYLADILVTKNIGSDIVCLLFNKI